MDENDEEVTAPKEQLAPKEEPLRRSMKAFEPISVEKSNTLLHLLYAQRDYPACKALIGELIEQYQGECEYPIFIRSVIAREECDLEESMNWMRKAQALARNDAKYLMHIGRLYLLMGNHTAAVEQLERSVTLDKMNYKAYFWLARAVYHLDTNLFDPAEKAKDILLNAPVLHHSAELLIFLAKLFTQLGESIAAIQTYKKALELEPENVELMVHLGMLYLRTKNEDPAFAMFGRALSYDAAHADSSVMQAHGDHDVALNKYRIAAEKCDYNGCLWNNIGMCLFAKGKFVAAISCLKKAAFLCPLEYRILYNLGLVHNAMQQYCSAYHFLAASLSLSPRNAQVLGTLAVTLSNMKDVNNAAKAYQRALSFDNDPQIILNYAIFEGQNGNLEKTRELFERFQQVTQEITVNQQLRQLAEKVAVLFLGSMNDNPPNDPPPSS
ncbi:unnamed protein product, partial [Mesorhabditis belari]|uniref:Uncharacterized protein n=1 Tax=Mesorhabditis belari TaxID=2138241 RepID=A0AAF3EB52_9BILA